MFFTVTMFLKLRFSFTAKIVKKLNIRLMKKQILSLMLLCTSISVYAQRRKIKMNKSHIKLKKGKEKVK
ncbi:hypothetical protein AD998_14850 [bacterium 336/3]|nr:hypothetical protein AD998_14850 [bacterium 336/3]